MKRALIVTLASLSLVAIAVLYAQKPAAATVEVYKSPTCGCCSKWVEHLREAGFTVRATDLPDAEIEQIKMKAGVPQEARSCHTALIDGYAIEGHVPAADVQRLLDERPAVSGIAVPGMPVGSPGMEVPSGQVQPYNVISFDKQGAMHIFATYDQ